jgi:hypothetical protein
VANDPIEERIRKFLIGELEAPRIVIMDYNPLGPNVSAKKKPRSDRR